MKICWVITDGSAGMENQAWGLGEALGYTVIIKRVQLRYPWLLFAPFIRMGAKWSLKEGSDTLESPFPDLVIVCGRRSVIPALDVKKRSLGNARVIYLQHPHISPKHFDMVICPNHDKLQGENVIRMLGAPHRITEEKLEEGRNKFDFSGYSCPRYGVLLGGPNKVYSFDLKAAVRIGDQLEPLLDVGSLLITPSRRTPPAIVKYFRERFSKYPLAYVWDGLGENPYFALLAWSDVVLLTCDSVSMASEVASSHAPMYFISLPGGSKKFKHFQDQLISLGRARWFKGSADSFEYTPFNVTESITKALLDRGFGA